MVMSSMKLFLSSLSKLMYLCVLIQQTEVFIILQLSAILFTDDPHYMHVTTMAFILQESDTK